MSADVAREAVTRMPTHVQRYVLEQMRSDLAGGRMSVQNTQPSTVRDHLKNKICENVENEDTLNGGYTPDPCTVLDVHSGDEIVTAVCKHYRERAG